jgi:hypothetical protein
MAVLFRDGTDIQLTSMGVDEDTIAGITAIDAAVDGTLDSSVCEAAAQVLGRQLCALRCRGQIEKNSSIHSSRGPPEVARPGALVTLCAAAAPNFCACVRWTLCACMHTHGATGAAYAIQ